MKLKTIAILALPLLTTACHYSITSDIMADVGTRTASTWSAAFWFANVLAMILALFVAAGEE